MMQATALNFRKASLLQCVGNSPTPKTARDAVNLVCLHHGGSTHEWIRYTAWRYVRAARQHSIHAHAGTHLREFNAVVGRQSKRRVPWKFNTGCNIQDRLGRNQG